jgi:Zn ribbon nucleic-acid-binding protein
MIEIISIVSQLTFIGVSLALVLFIYFFIKKQGRVVYLSTAKKLDPDEEVTTITPLSVHAATCVHKWDVLSEKTIEMNHEKRFVCILTCPHCGALDKTMQVTSKAPPPAPKTPCSHEWLTEVSQNLEMPHEKKLVLVLKCKNCGVLDKTTEVTSPIPAPAWTKEQCRHKWEVEKRVLIDSAYEQMLESIKVKTNNYSSAKKIDPNKELDLDLNNAPAWMFQKRYVSIRTCSVCGEVDKTIASNFDAEEENAEQENTDNRR